MRSTRLPVRRQSAGFSLMEVVVALAILGLGIVMLSQLFAMSLRTTKRGEDHTLALIHARSLLEEAYAATEPRGTGVLDFEDGFEGELTIVPMTTDEGAQYFELTATVTWTDGSVTLTGSRTVHEVENAAQEP